MGSDPTNNIENLAKKHKIECRAISMGQGQEVHARRLIQQVNCCQIIILCDLLNYVYEILSIRNSKKQKRFVRSGI